MNGKVTKSGLFTAVFMLMSLVTSCESDNLSYQGVGPLKNWTLQVTDTIVFTEIEQPIAIPHKVYNPNGEVVKSSSLHLPGYADYYTCQNDSVTMHYTVFEDQACNKTLRLYCYLPEGTVYKDVYFAFRPDLSQSTPTHPHIYVDKPGTLQDHIDPKMEKEITGLTLYGLLNTVDQIYLRKLLGAPETFQAWSEEVGMDVLDPNNNFIILPRDDEFFAQVHSEYNLSFLDLRNVVYKSVDDPEDTFFFLDYKVTDQYVKPKNIVRFLFYCCANLKEIYLPRWYEGINSCVFDMCGRLETVHYPDKLEEYAREITTARHFDDLAYCSKIRTFDLGKQTTKYKVDEEGSLWEVECNNILRCAKLPNRTRFDLPVGATLSSNALAWYPQLTDLYVHETNPSIYLDLESRAGYLDDLVSSQMCDRITFHVPQGYLQEFTNRLHFNIWPDMKVVDDVTHFVVTDSVPTKSTLRTTESPSKRIYTLKYANE